MRGSVDFTSEESFNSSFQNCGFQGNPKEEFFLSNKGVNIAVPVCSLECLIRQGDAHYDQRTTSGDLTNHDLK